MYILTNPLAIASLMRWPWLREPPILTSVIGAECSDGIALVADTQLTRSVDKELEFMDDEKIKADLEHFIVGYGQI